MSFDIKKEKLTNHCLEYALIFSKKPFQFHSNILAKIIRNFYFEISTKNLLFYFIKFDFKYIKEQK